MAQRPEDRLRKVAEAIVKVREAAQQAAIDAANARAQGKTK